MTQQSISFDRAADFYDETRSLPPAVNAAITQIMLDMGNFTTDDHLFEIGIGTGRIALPLAPYVANLTGVDLSIPMMNRLHAKRTTERVHVAQADGTQLPFADNTFDGAIAVHIFHLIPNYQAALAEVARVLKPGASLVLTRNNNRHGGWWELWREMLPKSRTADKGVQYFELEQILQENGWQPVRENVHHDYTIPITPQSYIDNLATRKWSHTWKLTDDELSHAIENLTTNLRERHADLNAPVDMPLTTVISVFNFAAKANVK